MKNSERHLIAASAFALALYNEALAMFRAPFGRAGQFHQVVPADLIRGSRFLLLIAALTLLLAVPGLVRGWRSAWLLALAAGVASALAFPLKNIDLWGIAGSLIFLGALLGARPLFSVHDEPPSALAAMATMIFGLGIVFCYAVVGLYFLDSEFRHSITLALAMKDGLRLMFVVPTIQSEPATRHAAGFVVSIRVAIIFVWVLTIFRLIQPVFYRRRRSQAAH
jgi:hypothetical protein